MKTQQGPVRGKGHGAGLLLGISMGIMFLGAVISSIFEMSWPSWMNTWQAHACFALPLALLGTIGIFGLAASRDSRD